MRKIVLYIAMSLDGYIADNKGSVNWLVGDNSDPQALGSYPKFIEAVDTVIMGYTTYHQVITELSPNHWDYAGKQTYVLTHRKCKNTNEITFTDISVEKLLVELKKENGKDVWICGGATVINPALKAHLIDEITISVIPTLLGNGIPLFETFDVEQKLELISTTNYNGIVDLVYRPRN